MHRLLAVAVVLLSPFVLSAADFKVGDFVFLKPDAEATKDGTKIEIKTIPTPATVEDIKGETVSLGKAWVRASDVMTADEAFEFYSETIRLDPKNAKAYFIRGWALATRTAMRVPFLFSESSANRYADDIENAINDFGEAIKLDPTNVEAYIARGCISMAIEDLTEAIRLSASNSPNVLASAYLGRASIWESKGEYDKAIEDSTEATKADSKSAPAFASIARLKSTSPDGRVRDGKQAVEYATKAYELIEEEIGQDRWFYLDTLAAAYAELGDFKNAIKWEEEALKRSQDKEVPAPRSLMASVICNGHLNLYRSNKPCRGLLALPIDASQEMLADDQQEMPDDAKQKLAQNAENSWGETFKKLDEAIKLNPADAYAHFNRGYDWALRAGVQPCDRDAALVTTETATFCENALNDLNEAIRLDPTVADAFATRGRVLAAMGKVETAIADLTEAIKLDPDNAAAYFTRGECWNNKGEFDKALQDWTDGLKLFEVDVKDGAAWLLLEPENKKAFFERIAWLKATCPDERLRNGKEAVKYALKASQSDSLFESVIALAADLFQAEWGEWRSHGTLAAAYAEAGDFKKAIKWQEKALTAAGEYWDDKTKDYYVPPGYKERLELYRANKPYRDIPKK